MNTLIYLTQDLTKHLDQIRKRYYIIPTTVKNNKIDLINITKREHELLKQKILKKKVNFQKSQKNIINNHTSFWKKQALGHCLNTSYKIIK